MLRRIRIGVSVVVFGALLLLFVGGEEWSSAFSEAALFLQFTPSLIEFVFSPTGYASIGFLIVIILTLLFGRVYCAALCPLGILQDTLIFLSKRFRGSAQYGFKNDLSTFRYAVLVATLVSAIIGSLAFVDLLDPFSVFGRIIADLFMPLVVLLNRAMDVVAQRLGVYVTFSLTAQHVSSSMLFVSLLFLAMLVISSLFRGRLYCNTVCPLGALLGLVSRWSLFQISNNEDACNACGLCEKMCRAECIESSSKSIDASRCVMCFDCLSVCPGNALKLEVSGGVERREVDVERREFIGSAVAAGAGALVLLSLPLRLLAKGLVPRGGRELITPPGSKSREAFMEKCVACHLCVSICPSKIIHPSIASNGLSGAMQPRLEYANGYCDYECRQCSEVCPSGAIAELSLSEKKLTQIGRVNYILEFCVVELERKQCGACAEVCPTQAVYTVDKGGLFYPVIAPDHCIGCGHCEHVCPAEPKAIYVQPLEVHGRAKEPVRRKTVEHGWMPDEEFPF